MKINTEWGTDIYTDNDSCDQIVFLQVDVMLLGNISV